MHIHHTSAHGQHLGPAGFMELLGYVGAINEQGIDVSVEQYPYSAGCTNITSSFFDNGFPGPGMIWIATQVVRRHRTHPRHTAPTGLHRARHHCSANAFQPFLSLSALDGVWRPGGADSSDIRELPSGDAAVGPGRVDHSAWPTGLRGAAAYHPPRAHTRTIVLCYTGAKFRRVLHTG